MLGTYHTFECISSKMELMYCVGKGKGMAIFFRHLGTVEVDNGSDLSSEPLDTFYSLLTIKLCQCVRWQSQE